MLEFHVMSENWKTSVRSTSICRQEVLQLRNQLYRQRRIRLLNEKTYAATQEKASRVESLVAEMRTDLKSLKGRLDVEIRELGISEEQAENILTSFYQSLDSQHLGDASPPKRQRRLSRMDEPESDEDMDDPLTDGAPEDANSADLGCGCTFGRGGSWPVLQRSGSCF